MRGTFLSSLFGMVLIVLTTFGATAQQADIESTITGQFEAFKADDFEGAFQFASPNLQMMFRSAENFKRMVTAGYPMVWKHSEFRFLDLREAAGTLWQKVQVTDLKGFTYLLDYQMVETPDGWRIAAVQLLDAPSVSA
ncbi:MAG: DUF4864 domain-containing protein [Sulfitobacter sp.]